MGYKISSAAAKGIAGMCASPEVVNICREKGIDVGSHRSSLLSCSRLEESDYVFVMTGAHRQMVAELCPAAADKCLLLGRTDISDPIGAGSDVYASCAEQIEKALITRLDEIL